MNFVKRYPFFVVAAVVLVAIAPVYFFVIRPVQEEMDGVHGDAMTLSDSLTSYINMGKQLPTQELIDAYAGWHKKYVTAAQQELGKLVARSKKLHELFWQHRIKWRDTYKVERGKLENRVPNAVPVMGNKPLDLPSFPSNREPTDEEMDKGQVAYSINKELIDILERATRAADIKGLYEIRMQSASIASGPTEPGGGGTALGGSALDPLDGVSEEYIAMFEDTGMSRQDIAEMLVGEEGLDTAGLVSGGGFRAEAVDRAKEQQLLGYVSRPFSIKVKLSPAGVPVLISELFKSEYFIRLNGMLASGNEDGTVLLDIYGEILDFSGAGV